MKDLCYPFEKKCRLTLGFKEKVKLANGTTVLHSGYDFGTVDLKKTPNLYAIWDGECLVATDKTAGNAVSVYNSKENASDITWHIKKVLVKAGQKVKKGDAIGILGKSGVYAEHTHVQFERGRSVRGTTTTNTLDPQPFFDRMTLKLDQKPPVVVPPVESTVVIPEKVYQALLAKELDDAKTIEALNSLLSTKNLEITKQEEKTQIEQDLKHKYQDGLSNVDSLLGVSYDINTEWDLQRYRYDEVLQKMRELAAKEALSGLIRRYVEKVRELLNKFKKK